MTYPLPGRRATVLLTSLFSAGFAATAAAAPKYESGSLAFSQPTAGTWKSLVFTTPFTSAPVVILGTPTHGDTAAITTRVRNVSATGFEYQIDEWDYLDGAHGPETIDYLAIEPGSHTIDGKTWKAGRAAGVTRSAQSVALGTGFTTAPVVIAQVESTGNAKAVASRVQSVTTTGFQVKAITQESDTAALSGESVGWIAVAAATGTLDGAPFLAGRTGTNVTDAWKAITYGSTVRRPLFFSAPQSANGADPFTLRQRNLTRTGVEIFLQEEQSAGTETSHGAEDVGFLVLGETAGEVRSKLEFGELVQAQAAPGTWHPVTFSRSYTNPVVVFGPATQNDVEPVGIRVRNVTATGFQWQFDEWDYQDGAHAQEQAHYVVAEEGSYVIGGLLWQFGRAAAVNQAAAAQTFGEAFPAVPAVLTQTVTRNGAAAVKSRVSGASATGFSVRLEEEGAADGTHTDETVHYLAVEAGNGRLVTPPYLSVHAGVTAAEVTEFLKPLAFARKLAEPFLFADAQTRNDTEAVTPRFANLTPGGAEIRLQEGSSLDVNTNHAAEKLGFLAISGALDTDEDGLPDAWELANGLDPNHPADAALDPDGDGLSNLAEHTYGTHPNSANGAGTITVAALAPDAFEKEGGRAAFLITRAGGVAPATVSFALNGTASAGDYTVKDDRGNTVAGSVAFAAGQSSRTIFIVPVADTLEEYPETVSLAITANAAYTTGSPSSATVKIKDATDAPVNEQLFVAYLTRQGTAQTYASGLATLHLNGSKTAARVNLSFSGLTSNQVNAYLRYGVTSGVGPELRPTLPIGQVTNETWTINPVGALGGQDLIDGLFQSGGKWVYLNIGTGTYPAGEIAGTFAKQTGSSTFTAPPAPPAPATLAGDALTRDVSRFLTQATFGARKAEIDALVTAIQTTHGGDRIAGYSAWIDAQFALDQTKLLDYTEAADAHEWALRGGSPASFVNNNEVNHHNRRRGWWLISAKAHDQLRQRTTFALSEIFVVSEELALLRTRHQGLANYYDLLGVRADGSFRSLLGDVSKSPIMGKYLSHLQNQKEITDANGNVLVSPDENYAREILQLFSIGLVHLHPDGSLKLGANGLPIATYGNDDITNLARVFTGWSFSKKHGGAGAGYPVQDNTTFAQGNGPLYFQASWTNPLKNFAAYHDIGAKTVLGSGIAAGLDGQDDLAAALDIIFAHPNVGPFISRQLIQRLVTSNPSRGYVYRVAQKFENNGSGTRGNLKAVVKAILLDPEARDLSLINQVGYGKQKEPIVRYLQLIRALDGKSSLPLAALSAYGYPAGQLNNFPAGTTLYRYPGTDDQLGQTPQSAPSVFNWFLPGFNPGGALASAGLVAPELQLSTETSVIRTTNYSQTLVQNNNGQNVNRLVGSTDDLEENVKLDRTPYETLYNTRITAGDTPAQAAAVVLDQLDLLLTAGNLKASYATAPVPNPRSITLATVASLDTATTTAARVKELLYLLVTSPEYVNQK